jgi:hypothetical protein
MQFFSAKTTSERGCDMNEKYNPIVKIYVMNMEKWEMRNIEITGRIEEIIIFNLGPFVSGKITGDDVFMHCSSDESVDSADIPVAIDIHLRPVKRLDPRQMDKDKLARDIKTQIQGLVLTNRPKILVDVYEPQRWEVGMSSSAE